MNLDPDIPAQDIEDRADLERLVDVFYRKIREDADLGPIFDQVARVDWQTHLPKIADFWETVLFRSGAYRGNPLAAHARLLPRVDLSRARFDRWLELFRETVDELFSGERAGHLVRCAEDMATVIHRRLQEEPAADPTSR